MKPPSGRACWDTISSVLLARSWMYTMKHTIYRGRKATRLHLSPEQLILLMAVMEPLLPPSPDMWPAMWQEKTMHQFGPPEWIYNITYECVCLYCARSAYGRSECFWTFSCTVLSSLLCGLLAKKLPGLFYATFSSLTCEKQHLEIFHVWDHAIRHPALCAFRWELKHRYATQTTHGGFKKTQVQSTIVQRFHFHMI
jgi:hypothetical protein